jgi:molybdopterin/thiamine biosynthesis adenylyltransferase
MSDPVPAAPRAASSGEVPLRIDAGGASAEDRFARFKLIAWWDQAKLARTKVLLIGAGALGNELLKNLALLGVGNVLVADLDTIEKSNLSRSVLYRPEHEGQPKALVAARAARELYPAIRTEAFRGNVCTQLGLGAFRWADVVIGGLDNREARLWTNRASLRVGRPWVDGAIEALAGVARVFTPGDGACYECTLGENDWKLLAARRACTLLTRAEIEGGRTPTTPTTSSVIAGIQCQEALKLLHGLETLAGKGFVFDGHWHQSYVVTYTRNPDCMSHDPLPDVLLVDRGSDEVTLGELLGMGLDAMGPAPGDGAEPAVLDFGRDVIGSLTCTPCGTDTPALVPLGAMTEDEARCPACKAVRAPILLNHLAPGDPLLGRTPAEVGLPPWDILTVRRGEQQLGLELAGDRELVLGALAVDDEEAP